MTKIMRAPQALVRVHASSRDIIKARGCQLTATRPRHPQNNGADDGPSRCYGSCDKRWIADDAFERGDVEDEI
jgi:hypothetical protein